MFGQAGTAPGPTLVPPSTRVAVTVTFLRMDLPPSAPAPRLPDDGTAVVAVPEPTVPFYRYLYDTVGAAHVWWLRRAMTDEALAALLANPAIGLWVLYHGGEPAGFAELEVRAPDVNLSYFGLMPHMVGRGVGPAFLRAAVDLAWARRPRSVTVNTCTADHPRALGTYLRCGFRPVRTVREVWDVPGRLGMAIPDHLRI